MFKLKKKKLSTFWKQFINLFLIKEEKSNFSNWRRKDFQTFQNIEKNVVDIFLIKKRKNGMDNLFQIKQKIIKYGNERE